MTHLSWPRPFLSVTSYGYVGIYRVINTFIEKEGEEQSSICFPNKNPGTEDVEIGACFSAASGEGARVWDLLWGKGEGKCGFGNQHYSSLHLNCVFYVHFHDLIWSSQTNPRKKDEYLHFRNEAPKVKCFCQTEVSWDWNSDQMTAEFKTLACPTLPPTGREGKCSFFSHWLWIWNLIFKCLGSWRFVKPDGQPRSKPCL